MTKTKGFGLPPNLITPQVLRAILAECRKQGDTAGAKECLATLSALLKPPADEKAAG